MTMIGQLFCVVIFVDASMLQSLLVSCSCCVVSSVFDPSSLSSSSSDDSSFSSSSASSSFSADICFFKFSICLPECFASIAIVLKTKSLRMFGSFCGGCGEGVSILFWYG